MESVTQVKADIQPLQLLVGNGKNAKYVKGKTTVFVVQYNTPSSALYRH